MDDSSDSDKEIEYVDVSKFIEIKQISNNNSLLKFCETKNNGKYNLNEDEKKALAYQASNIISSVKTKTSLETIFELSILIFGKVDLSKLNSELNRYSYLSFSIYSKMDFYDNENGNFNNLTPVFDFIKQHKKPKAKTCKRSFHIDLIYGFLNCGECIKNYCAKDFFDLDLLKFTDTNSYKNLSCNHLERIVDILQRYLERDKNNREQIVEAMYNIFEFAPSKFLYKDLIVKLLKSLRDNNAFNAEKINKIIERLITLDGYRFPQALMILSYCKKNSVPGDIFKKAINHWAENKQDLFKSFSLKIPQQKLEELNNQGKNIAEIEDKYNKYIFTPSLINFIKQKFDFDKDYSLEKTLKDNFGEDNFADGDNCDLEAILYRLFFEDYMLVPHKKEDVIKSFETTKFAFPPYNKSLKESFYSDFGNIWDSNIAFDFFSNMNTLAQEIICERQNNRQNLTLADLKIIALSSFRFGGLTKINEDHDTQYFWQEQLFYLIPNKICDKYYFRWVLQIFQNQSQGISKKHLMNLLKRYKFNDTPDFDDFCLAMENILVADNYYLYSTVDKIKVESDVDILSALLDSCDDKIFLDNQSNSTFYIRKIISNTKNQELIDKMNNKFNPRLIKKQNKILMSNDNHLIIENPNSSNGQSKSKTIVNQKSNKTPLWLIIITLGLAVLIPWLFKKMFGSCCNFEGGNVIVDEDKNRKNLNQGSVPKQGSNFEEKLYNRGN